jgi:hypothetical protein
MTHPTWLKTIKREDIEVKWKHHATDKKPLIVKNDLVAIITDLRRQGDYGFLIEADRGNEDHSVLLEKLTRIALMLDDGKQLEKFHLKNMRVLILTKSRERAINVHGLPYRKDLKIPDGSPLPKELDTRR